MIQPQRDLVGEAYVAYQQGQLSHAEALALEGLQAAEDVRLIELLGAIRAAEGRWPEALRHFEHVLELQPENLQATRNVAAILYGLGLRARAIPYLQQLRRQDPTDADVCERLALCYIANGMPTDVAAAQAEYEALVQLRPNDAAAFRELGRVLGWSSREKEAERALRRATELAPDDLDARHLLALALVELDELDEAISELEHALARDPEHEACRLELDRLQARKSTRTRRRMARYPRAQREFADVERVIEEYILPEFRDVAPRLHVDTPIFTMGSCFAHNIAMALNRLGNPAQFFRYTEDINSTYGNRYLLEWLNGADGPEHESYAAGIDGTQREDLRGKIARAQTIILSLGVAPGFFHRETGRFTSAFGSNFQVALQNDEYEFRTTTVAENVDNLRAILTQLRSLSPHCTFVLTVSPVPLKATFEFASAFTADCISKSTLRVAAAELIRERHPNVYYWPSFEMVRWFGGHVGPVFGEDDGSPFHVNEAVINRILFTFLRVFGHADLVLAAQNARAS